MSPALNGSSTLERFERSSTSEICNGIMFDFYPGLPHTVCHNTLTRCVVMVALMTAWTKVCASWPQQTIFPVREVIAPESNLKIICEGWAKVAVSRFTVFIHHFLFCSSAGEARTTAAPSINCEISDDGSGNGTTMGGTTVIPTVPLVGQNIYTWYLAVSCGWFWALQSFDHTG